MGAVEVDLSELAAFANDTKYSHAFDLVAERLTLANVGGLVQPQLQKRSETESDRDDIAAHVFRRFHRFFDCFGAPNIVPCDKLDNNKSWSISQEVILV